MLPQKLAKRDRRTQGDGMTGQSRPYVIHSDDECERLERQAVLAALEEHLGLLTDLPPFTGILDAGCGFGSMASLLAAKYPDARARLSAWPRLAKSSCSGWPRRKKSWRDWCSDRRSIQVIHNLNPLLIRAIYVVVKLLHRCQFPARQCFVMDVRVGTVMR